jgi:hypothetical protein
MPILQKAILEAAKVLGSLSLRIADIPFYHVFCVRASNFAIFSANLPGPPLPTAIFRKSPPERNPKAVDIWGWT